MITISLIVFNLLPPSPPLSPSDSASESPRTKWGWQSLTYPCMSPLTSVATIPSRLNRALCQWVWLYGALMRLNFHLRASILSGWLQVDMLFMLVNMHSHQIFGENVHNQLSFLHGLMLSYQFSIWVCWCLFHWLMPFYHKRCNWVGLLGLSWVLQMPPSSLTGRMNHNQEYSQHDTMLPQADLDCPNTPSCLRPRPQCRRPKPLVSECGM